MIGFSAQGSFLTIRTGTRKVCVRGAIWKVKHSLKTKDVLLEALANNGIRVILQQSSLYTIIHRIFNTPRHNSKLDSVENKEKIDINFIYRQ